MTSVRSNSGLGRWFREKWVDISRPKEGGGFEPCGRSDTSKGRYPKCVPAATAARMSPEEIKSAIRRKRRAESSVDRDGKAPIMVSTFKDGRPSKRARTFKKNKPADPQLYAKVKAEARRRFDVYPSAYANGWLVQEYKRRGGRYLRASAAPDSTVLVCTSTVVLACKSKACAPPPVGTGGSKPSGKSGGQSMKVRKRMSPWPGVSADVYDAWSESHRKRRNAMMSESVDMRLAATTVEQYTTDGSHRINRALRNESLDEMNPMIAGDVADMKRAFSRLGVKLPEDATVYRGMTMYNELDVDDVMSMFAPGSEFTDKAFVSTSTSKRVADGFAATKSLASKDPEKQRQAVGVGVRMRIKVPKGTKVLAGARQEQEFILNAGTKFVVKSVKQPTPSFVTVELEVVS